MNVHLLVLSLFVVKNKPVTLFEVEALQMPPHRLTMNVLKLRNEEWAS